MDKRNGIEDSMFQYLTIVADPHPNSVSMHTLVCCTYPLSQRYHRYQGSGQSYAGGDEQQAYYK